MIPCGRWPLPERGVSDVRRDRAREEVVHVPREKGERDGCVCFCFLIIDLVNLDRSHLLSL